MLEWRHLENDAVQSSDNTTYKFDLPKQGQLHALLLKLSMTNGATAGRNVDMLDVVDNIEIKGKGNETLYSLVPNVVEKLYEAMRGQAMTMINTEAASAVQTVVIPIWFGRAMFDPNYWLPLAAVAIAQLQIAYSPNIAADGGFATGTFTVDIMALMSDQGDVGNYLGTLVTKEIRNFTTAASGDEATQVSDPFPHRYVGVYCYENQVADGVDVTRVRLTTKDRSHTPFDFDWDNFVYTTRSMFGAIIEHAWQLFAQDNDVLDTRQGDIMFHSVTVETSNNATTDVSVWSHIDTITGDRVTLDSFTLDNTAGGEDNVIDTTDRVLKVLVKSRAPSYFGLIVFSPTDDPADYFNPDGKEKVEVILTQGGAGGDARIFTQTVRRFA